MSYLILCKDAGNPQHGQGERQQGNSVKLYPEGVHPRPRPRVVAWACTSVGLRVRSVFFSDGREVRLD